MPYVKQERRPELDKVVEAMVKAGVKADGDLNYVLYKYFLKFIPKNYNSFKNYCGELHQAATEIERRLLGPYEDEKIIENGDV